MTSQHRTALFFLVLGLSSCTGKDAAEDPTLVTAKPGKIKGMFLHEDEVVQFLGIPYAAPPIGDLRWEHPQKAHAWGDNIYMATKAMHGCSQPVLPKGAFPDVARPETISEDCLYLNIWVPNRSSKKAKNAKKAAAAAASASAATAKAALTPNTNELNTINLEVEAAQQKKPATDLLPVYVFIHGGTFSLGHAAAPFLNGTQLARSGVVVVTMNYRLGALGFLAYDVIEGNYGFMDQVMALRWVKDNIEHFGGNPNLVTLGGQSAGAISTCAHVTNEVSKGLFHRAILQSPFLGLPFLTHEQAEKQVGAGFVTRVGCPDLKGDALRVCLRNLSSDAVLSAQEVKKDATTIFSEAYGSVYTSSVVLPFSPVISGPIQGQPLQKFVHGDWHRIPIMAGYTRDEFVTWTFDLPTIGQYSYDAMVYSAFGVSVGQRVLSAYPAIEGQDLRMTLSMLLRDMFVACPLRGLTQINSFPAYIYRFDHVWSDTKLLLEYEYKCSGYVCHSSELPLTFGGALSFDTMFPGNVSELHISNEERVLADGLLKRWRSFIANGSPGRYNHTAWPTAGAHGSCMIIDTPVKALASFPEDRCNMWDEIGYFW